MKGEGTVELLVLPTFPNLVQAVRLLSPVHVGVGAQGLSWADRGPFTGEVNGTELGCRFAEMGHLERRTHLGQTDARISRNTAAASRNRLVPVICVGESFPGAAHDAAHECSLQLPAVLTDSRRDGCLAPAVVAYEPHWAIGAEAAARPEHIRTVCARLRADVQGDQAMTGTRVIDGQR